MRGKECFFSLIFISIFLLFSEFSFGLVDMGKEILEVKPEIETPHTCWAKPYNKGKIKGLIIGPYFGHRETIELWQRMDLEYQVVMTKTHLSLGDNTVKGFSEDDIKSLLMNKLKENYDVIIIGNVEWDIIPSDAQKIILEKVSEGCGFIYYPAYKSKVPEIFNTLFTKSETPDFMTELPFEVIKNIDEKNFHQTFTYKNGRVILIKYALTPPKPHFNFLLGAPINRTEYEYSMAALIKGILWAGKKEPDIKIQFKTFHPEKVEFNIEGEKDIKNKHIQVIIKDIDYEEEFTDVFSIDKYGDFSISIPPLKEGSHLVDITVLGDKKVVNWASSSFKVSSDFKIEGLELDKEFYRPGQQALLKTTITPIKEISILRVELIDNFGRIISKQEKEIVAENKEIIFKINLPDKGTIFNTIKASIYIPTKNTPVSEKKISIYVPPKGHQGFALFSWVAAGSDVYYGELLGKYMYNLGFDSAMGTSSNTGLRSMPYTIITYGGKQDPINLIRKPCLTDADYLKESKEKVSKLAKELAKDGPIGYGLGDEPNLTTGSIDLCFSPSCLSGFRNYLKSIYKDIENLNKEWETNYKDWEEIDLQSYQKAAEKYIKTPWDLFCNNRSHWLDHRLYMDSVFTNYFCFLQECIKEVDDAARCGPEGIWSASPNRGIDWYGLCKNLGMVIPYSRPGNNLGREAVCWFANKEMLTGTWYGGYVNQISDSYYLTREPWLQLLHNATSIGWYNPYNYCHLGHIVAGILPDFRLTSGMSDSMKEIDKIKGGIDEVIMNSNRSDNSIAILYSRASLYAYYNYHGQSHNELCPLIEDLGYQYRIISSEELEEGILEKGTFHMIVLPNAVALSDKEINSIKEFVNKGGTVLADLPPAIYDGHGKKRLEGGLNEIFGIKEVKFPFIRKDGEISIKSSFPLVAFSVNPYAEVIVNNAEIYGKINNSLPSVLVSTYGKGRGVLLNFRFNEYREDAIDFEKLLPIQTFMYEVMKRYGPAKYAEIKDLNGNRIYGYEFLPYLKGDDIYLGIMKRQFKKDEQPEKVEISFPKKFFIYEITENKFFGNTDRVEDTIPVGPAKIYALFSKPLLDFQFILEKDSFYQGEDVNYKIILPPDENRMRIFRFEVKTPDGKKAKYFSQTIITEGKNIQDFLPLAFNERHGKWELILKDVVSGKTIKKEIIINERRKK